MDDEQFLAEKNFDDNLLKKILRSIAWRIQFYFILFKDLPKILKVFWLIDAFKKDYLRIFLHRFLYPLKISIINQSYVDLDNKFSALSSGRFQYAGLVFEYLPLKETEPQKQKHLIECFNWDIESIMVSKEFEWEQVKVSQNDVVFDCGANIGVFSLFVAPLAKKVYSFEPATQNIRSLQRNIELNSVGNVQIVPKALSNEAANTKLVLSDSLANYLIRQEDERPWEDLKTEAVQTITLDGFAAQNGLTKIDFIKVDVEGADSRVILGAKSILFRHKPKLFVSLAHKNLIFIGFPFWFGD